MIRHFKYIGNATRILNKPAIQSYLLRNKRLAFCRYMSDDSNTNQDINSRFDKILKEQTSQEPKVRESSLKEETAIDLDSLFADFKDEVSVKTNPKEPIRSENSEQQEFDKLLESLEFSSHDKQEPIRSDEFLTSPKQDLRKIDIDKNDENTYELDDISKEDARKNKFINEERNLLQNIFNTYITEPEHKNIEDEVLWNMQDSLKNTKRQVDQALRVNKTNFHLLSKGLKRQIFEFMELALQPVYTHIDTNLKTPASQIDFLRSLLNTWYEIHGTDTNEELSDQVLNELYLNSLFVDKEFDHRHSQILNDNKESIEQNASSPKVNVITLPLIFNKILHNLSYNFYNGQLTINLFNFIKQDLELYAIMVNQQTYNEILRTYWTYFGKSNLYGIEMIFTEMRNNGFEGDLMTVNIVKQILIDYYNLKLGKNDNPHLELNSDIKVPIWTIEDDARANNLQRQIQHLASSLVREDQLDGPADNDFKRNLF